MKAAVIGAAMAGLLVAGAAQAQEGTWLVRGRVLSLTANNGNSPEQSLGKVEVSNKVLPDLDISYFFSKNIAAELVLTVPQTHDVKLGGNKIGTVKELPPTLTVQYHFLPDGPVDPYLGAGINYTRFWGADFDPAVSSFGLTVKNQSVGFAVQAGLDYKIDKNWSLNFDVKYAEIKTDVNTNGTKFTELKISPVLVGIGAGYRF